MLRIILGTTTLALLAIIAFAYMAKKRDEKLFQKLSGKVMF